MKPNRFIRFVWLAISAALISSCSRYLDVDYGDPDVSTFGKFEIGTRTEFETVDIPVSGGIIQITETGTPLDGLELKIPSNSFSSVQPINLSYAEITDHDFGENFNPISPLITISCEGGYSNDIMTLTIPCKIPSGSFPVGFMYDEETGKFEGIPVKSITQNSISLLTRHFLSGSRLRNLPSKMKLSNSGTPGGANIVVCSFSETLLNKTPTISSGFQPGVDDWEFSNQGSYISQGGHCSGQNMAAMWYYYERKPVDGPLNGHFSIIQELDVDNALGWRFCSVIHQDLDWDGTLVNLFGKFIDKNQELDQLKFLTIASTMLLTGEPQGIGIYRRNGQFPDGTAKYSGHDLICYAISTAEGKLYISDPNYPNEIRHIDFKDGSFSPYVSSEKVGVESREYPFITYYAKTAYIPWDRIYDRYEEVVDGTIGNNIPKFPQYSFGQLSGINGIDLKQDMTLTEDSLIPLVYCQINNGAIFRGQKLASFRIFDESGQNISSENGYGWEQTVLPPGRNLIYFYIYGTDSSRIEEYYIDFKPFVVYVPDILTSVKDVSNTSVVIEGNIVSVGLESAMARGVCLSIINRPDVTSLAAVDAESGLWKFNVTIEDLIPGTTYYARACSKISSGFVYGKQIAFTTTGHYGEIKGTAFVNASSNTDLAGAFVQIWRTNTAIALDEPPNFERIVVGSGSSVSFSMKLPPYEINETYKGYLLFVHKDNDGNGAWSEGDLLGWYGTHTEEDLYDDLIPIPLKENEVFSCTIPMEPYEPLLMAKVLNIKQ